jgi:hypothetical protein
MAELVVIREASAISDDQHMDCECDGHLMAGQTDRTLSIAQARLFTAMIEDGKDRQPWRHPVGKFLSTREGDWRRGAGPAILRTSCVPAGQSAPYFVCTGFDYTVHRGKRVCKPRDVRARDFGEPDLVIWLVIVAGTHVCLNTGAYCEKSLILTGAPTFIRVVLA